MVAPEPDVGCCGREKANEMSRALPDEETKGCPDCGHAGAKNDRSRTEDAVSVVDDVACFRLAERPSWLPQKMASCVCAGTDVKTAICSAFRATDEELVNLLVQGSSGQEISCGTVVCVGLVEGKDLWIANLGDCRAVACNQNKVESEAISFDHSPLKNKAEVTPATAGCAGLWRLCE